jgi:hypothetical protein
VSGPASCTLHQDPQLVARLCAPLLAAAEAHNQLQAERLTRLCQEGSQLQAQAEAAADQLKELFYSLTAQLREAQAQAEAAVSRGGWWLRLGCCSVAVTLCCVCLLMPASAQPANTLLSPFCCC